VCGPGLPLTSGHSDPVQRRRDLFVGPSGGHAPHNSESLLGRAAAMLAGFWLANPQMGMLAASPMDRQNDLTRVVVDVGDDLDDEGPQEALASAHGHAWCVPCGIEVLGEVGEVGRCGGRVWRPALPPIALRKFARGEARLPSSSRVAKRSDDCRGRRRRSAAQRVTLHTGPAAAPARRCAVVRLGFPCASARLPVRPRSPSAQRRGEALGQSRRRHGDHRTLGTGATPASGWEGYNDRRVVLVSALNSLPSDGARNVHRKAAQPTARVRRVPTLHLQPWHSC